MYEDRELKYQFDLQGHRHFIESLPTLQIFHRVDILSVIVFQDGIYSGSQAWLRELRRWYFQHLTVLYERTYSAEDLTRHLNYYAAHFAGFGYFPERPALSISTLVIRKGYNKE